MRVLTKICIPSRASVLAKVSIPTLRYIELARVRVLTKIFILSLRYRVGSGESLDEYLSSVMGECLGEDLYSDNQM